MAKYRKKPVVIEAIQYKVIEEIPCKYGVAKKTNIHEIAPFMKVNSLREVTTPNDTPEGETFLPIDTLEGIMKASIGDYIIKEPFDKKRQFYPCKPNIFEQTYELVEQ